MLIFQFFFLNVIFLRTVFKYLFSNVRLESRQMVIVKKKKVHKPAFCLQYIHTKKDKDVLFFDYRFLPDRLAQEKNIFSYLSPSDIKKQTKTTIELNFLRNNNDKIIRQLLQQIGRHFNTPPHPKKKGTSCVLFIH